MIGTLIDNLKTFLHVNTTAEYIFFYAALIFASIIAVAGIVYAFLYTCACCSEIEEETGKQSHPLIKAGLIALAPAIYTTVEVIAETFCFPNFIPKNYILLSMAVFSIVTLIWNLAVFGFRGGIIFTLLHTVFGGVASLLVAIFVELAIIAVVFWIGSILFGNGGIPENAGGSGSSASKSIPTFVRDPKTSKSYYVTKGANNEPYVVNNGEYIPIRNGDFSNTFIDTKDNRYVK